MLAKESVLAELKRNTGLAITPEKVKAIESYIEILKESNKKFNLTAIVEEGEIWRKHVLDSLLIFFIMDIPPGARLIDVGTGAGIPGILLKICRPDLKVTLLDARKKKVSFLKKTVLELGLVGVECVWGRAEAIGRQASCREGFNIAVARGVARLNLLVEYCLPLVEIGGSMVAYKGPEGKQELKEAQKAISLLGGREARIWQKQLLDGEEKRNLIIIKKEKKTPENYPRRAGVPAKRPIK